MNPVWKIRQLPSMVCLVRFDNSDRGFLWRLETAQRKSPLVFLKLSNQRSKIQPKDRLCISLTLVLPVNRPVSVKKHAKIHFRFKTKTAVHPQLADRKAVDLPTSIPSLPGHGFVIRYLAVGHSLASNWQNSSERLRINFHLKHSSIKSTFKFYPL